jgi:hypothetical protein
MSGRTAEGAACASLVDGHNTVDLDGGGAVVGAGISRTFSQPGVASGVSSADRRPRRGGGSPSQNIAPSPRRYPSALGEQGPSLLSATTARDPDRTYGSAYGTK